MPAGAVKIKARPQIKLSKYRAKNNGINATIKGAIITVINTKNAIHAFKYFMSIVFI